MNVCLATITATLVILASIPGLASEKPRQIKIRGYVTNVTSPTQFEIEDYRITRDQAFVLEFDNESPEVRFRPEDIKVGVELEIKGYLDETTNTLRPTSIKVDLEQFKKAKHTAVIAYSPVGVTRDGVGWSGRFVADGQRIEVTPATKVLFKLTSRERKLAKEAAKTEDEEDDDAFEPLKSLEQVTAGMLMSYEGPRTPDGAIRAERVEFSRNDLEKGEAKLWKSLTAEVKPFSRTKPPELKINHVGKFKLIHDEEVQTYISRLGQSLIPAHQRDLASGDPLRLNFRFFVVDDKSINAFATANGVIIVNAGMFAMFENEAQLAAVVGHEIAHATQEHTWRQSQFHKKKRFALGLAAAVAAGYGKYNVADLLTLTLAAVQNGYSRSLENQADRVGLEYMVSAGYDPRQAPQVWKAMTKATGLQATDFFWSSHDNHATRRSYLMNELKTNHADLNYTTLKANSEVFPQMQARVVSASREKIKIRVAEPPSPARLAVQSPVTPAEPGTPAPTPAAQPASEEPTGVTAPSEPALVAQTASRVSVVRGAPIFLVPDSNRSPLRVTTEESSLKVVEQSGEWYRVEFRDPQWGTRVGYVHQRYIRTSAK